MEKDYYQALYDFQVIGGELNYQLEVFGFELAKRQKYQSNLGGIESIHFYLIQKHGWLPRDVRSMSPEDIRFVLSEEMVGWVLPEDARVEGVSRK